MTEQTAPSDSNLYELIYKDDLTGLFNRRYFNEEVEKKAGPVREGRTPYSFIMFDIDHFKSINDGYSHQEGDHVLRRVSYAVQECIEDKGTVTRYAGDEFVVLLPGFTKEEARKVAWELRNYISSNPIRTKSTNTPLKITLSLGVATSPDDCEDLRELIHVADDAAYLSKKKGRNTVSLIDEKESEDIEVRSLHRFFPSTHFTGRDELLKELTRKAVPAAGEKKPFVIIMGAPGMGKSRLLTEIADSLDPQRYLHLRFQSNPATSAQPFCEIIDTLNRKFNANQELASALSEKLSIDEMHVIVPLIPIFSQFCIQAPSQGALSPEQKRDLLLQALERMLIELSALSPLLVLIDDYQWSNLGTQLLLEKIKTNPGGASIPVFATIDEDEVRSHKDMEFLAYIQRMEDKGFLVRQKLLPLDSASTEKLIHFLIPGIQGHQALVSLIVQKSFGIPLYIESILKHLIWKRLIHSEEGNLIIEDISDSLIPELPGGIVSASIQELDEEVRGLLCKASVIGERFSIDLLKKIDGRPEAYLDDLIARAEKAAVISLNPQNEPDTFVFTDNSIHNSLYQSIEEEEKKSYHLQLAEIEQEIHKDNIDSVLSRISYHFKHAGDVDRARQFFEALIRDYENFLSPKVINLYVDQQAREKEWGEEKTLSHEQESQALRVINTIQVTMDNLGQFPLESEIVRGSFESSFWELRKLFEHLDLVSLADGDGELLINSRKIAVKGKEIARVESFLKTMAKVGLKGITIKKEVKREHFLEFLKLIITDSREALENEGGWTSCLTNRGITSIVTNERIFVAMAEKDLFSARKLKEEHPVVTCDEMQVPEPLPEVPQELSGLLSSLMEEIESIKGNILEKGEWGEDVDKVTHFLDRIFKKHDIIENLLARLTPHIEELERRAAETIQPQSPLTIDDSAERTHAADFINLSRKLDLLTLSKMRMSPDTFVRDLESKDDETSSSAAIALAQTGNEGISVMLNYIKSTDSMLGRKRALHTLKSMLPDINLVIAKELMGNTKGEEKRRIIETLHDFSDIDISESIRYFLRSPDPDVRQAIINLILLRTSDRTQDFLLEALSERPTEENLYAIKDAIEALGKLGRREAVDPLCLMIRKKSIFQHDPFQELQEAACLTLGKLGDASVVPHLLKALRITPSVFLLKNKSNRVRAAAAYALSNFPSEEARRILQEAARDVSTDVRSAASIALHSLNKTLPRKDGSPVLGDPQERKKGIEGSPLRGQASDQEING